MVPDILNLKLDVNSTDFLRQGLKNKDYVYCSKYVSRLC